MVCVRFPVVEEWRGRLRICFGLCFGTAQREPVVSGYLMLVKLVLEGSRTAAVQVVEEQVARLGD
jgi:hypothetical protein